MRRLSSSLKRFYLKKRIKTCEKAIQWSKQGLSGTEEEAATAKRLIRYYTNELEGIRTALMGME